MEYALIAGLIAVVLYQEFSRNRVANDIRSEYRKLMRDKDEQHRDDMRYKDEIISDLQLRFMAKDIKEYRDHASDEPPENMEGLDDVYKGIEELTNEEIEEAMQS